MTKAPNKITAKNFDYSLTPLLIEFLQAKYPPSGFQHKNKTKWSHEFGMLTNINLFGLKVILFDGLHVQRTFCREKIITNSNCAFFAVA